MCGISGYTGKQPAAPILYEGLRTLEYRGYDSAGLATVAGGTLHIRKCAGRLAQLGGLLSKRPLPGNCGIGHTRWATHGGITDANAHPHIGGDGLVAIVHNGIVENYEELRRDLQRRGYVFRSETDSEVLAHLIASCYKGDLLQSVSRAVTAVVGTYALAVISPRHEGMIVGARSGSPIVLGLGNDEMYLGSDLQALAAHTDQFIYLKDHDLFVLTPESCEIFDRDCQRVDRRVDRVEVNRAQADQQGFEHFMLKEIYEQPAAILRALDGRIDEANASIRLPDMTLDRSRIKRVLMIACGSSYHAALVGEYLFEQWAGIPTEVEFASEFRYRRAPLESDTLVLVISQSGETADTLAALREARRLDRPVLALCNAAENSMAREANAVLLLNAGWEIGVASTKTFTSQLVVLSLLALSLAETRGMPRGQRTEIIQHLRSSPGHVQRILAQRAAVARIAAQYAESRLFLLLGRQFLYPVALEGALKLKEIGYIPALGYPAGEMKHGPIALIEPGTTSVFLAPRNAVYSKTMSNLEEIRARQGRIIALATDDDQDVASKVEDVIFVPAIADALQPLLTVVPLQLLAYEIARLRGCDIDKPRNLAKSVTVE